MEKEVISGKGQFICGNRECSEKDGLGSYEVNFSYFEAGESKQALVKLVACKRCAEKLVYKRRKDEKAPAKETDKRKQKETELIEVKEKDKYKRKRDKIKGDDDSSDEYDRSPRKKGSRKKDGKSSDEYNFGSRKRGHKGLLDPKDAEDEEFDDFLEGMFP